jgi:succinate-semialdehyde dehydrogenase / glutarate-semialdehyde dehydrogenase
LQDGPTNSPTLNRIPDLEALADFASGASGPRCAVIAPFTGQVLGEIAFSTAADASQALLRARTAQASWALTSMAERRRIFMRFHDLVLAERETIMDLLQLEGGKARVHAYEELLDVAVTTRYYAIHARRILASHQRPGALPFLTSTRVYYHPVGVVGIIAPWNYPFTMAISDGVPAMMAGNAVVLKPSEFTPYSALNVVRLLRQAGLPEGVFQVVVGEGREVGAALASEADFVQFTGSTVTGKQVARATAERLIKSSLELGGKNAALVMDDANLDLAVHGVVRSVVSNAGQLCVSIERLYVQDGIFERFIERLIPALRVLCLGVQMDFSADVGSLLSQDQLDKVQAHVQDALAKGARVLVGGKARPDLGPFFYEPTLLEGVTPDMKLYTEETFGPVVSVYRFQSEDEGISMANDTCYGLNADLWTGSRARVRRIAPRIHAGTVNVNETYSAGWGSIAAPMGGRKQSGLGRRHGPEGLLKYIEEQTVAHQLALPLYFVPGVRRVLLANLMVWYLKLIQYIPGLR